MVQLYKGSIGYMVQLVQGLNYFKSSVGSKIHWFKSLINSICPRVQIKCLICSRFQLVQWFNQCKASIGLRVQSVLGQNWINGSKGFKLIVYLFSPSVIKEAAKNIGRGGCLSFIGWVRTNVDVFRGGTQKFKMIQGGFEHFSYSYAKYRKSGQNWVFFNFYQSVLRTCTFYNKPD